MLINIPLAMYTSMVHQRGPLEVSTFVYDKAGGFSTTHANSSSTSVFYMMPCHSVPAYAHVHHNISMRFLECPPRYVCIGPCELYLHLIKHTPTKQRDRLQRRGRHLL
eukprot:Colp12_sorted_trinity150504_noHs@27646